MNRCILPVTRPTDHYLMAMHQTLVSVLPPAPLWSSTYTRLYQQNNPTNCRTHPAALKLDRVQNKAMTVILETTKGTLNEAVVFLSCPLVKKHADLFGSFLYKQSTMKDMYSKPTNRTELSIPMNKKPCVATLYIQTKDGSGKGNN